MTPPPTHPRKLQVEALAVRLFPRQPDLAADAAVTAAGLLREAIAARGQARVVLAAANSQIQTLDALIAAPGVDWARVTVLHMDEYLGLDPQHPASFRRFLRERVADRVPLAAFHGIAGEAEEPLAECDRYAALLAAAPVDLCLCGIGENGHLAFNDPPVADFADRRTIKLVKLDEACRRQQVGEGHFATLAEVPQFAYTLTIPALLAARRVLCIAPEQRKARAVADALQGPVATACPASFLRRQAHATLFLDAESASLLAPP
jgi:glucosamine-6-phosphate deaminase